MEMNLVYQDLRDKLINSGHCTPMEIVELLNTSDFISTFKKIDKRILDDYKRQINK